MKPFIYPRGRYARDGVTADFLHCFDGPDGGYLGLKKKLKIKASIFLYLSTNV